MNTIDVLLWTVQADKQAGDRDRFNRINPRLLDNLQKALEIGGASKTKITKAMRQLKQIQEYTFHKAEVESQESPTGVSPLARKEPPLLPREDPYLRRVEKMPLGTWIEFRNTLGQTVRCALVSKIDSIDKLFFADKQGKKVAELTRNRLAREMKLGTVKVVSEGALVNRALQKVINELKETAKAESKSDKGVATG
jgi:transcriptional regulator NrdR family protein